MSEEDKSQLNDQPVAQEEPENEEEKTFKPAQIDQASVPHILEQARDAKAAAEPVGTKVGDNVEGAKQWGAEKMTVKAMHSAGWVKVYDTVTREPSIINRNWLAQQLNKKRPDGTFYFTTVKPDKPPRRGTIKCMLHPDSPNRDHYNKLGLPECPKATLPNKHQQMLHMQHRHPQEWATIKEEIEDQKEAQREHDNQQFQKAVSEALKATTKKGK